MQSISCELSDKNSEEWSNVCLKPQMVGVGGWTWGAGGYEDVRSPGGLSSTHTVIQMAKNFKATAQTSALS